ncbi:MAG TPA: hypothetical protein VN806_08270 [Caulobacteraceae bacterium]|jgi:hypothetical protein|nr:hypothetical protein [Caulobacteraceae bacterium]
MSVDGNWNIVVSSPMGDQPSTLSLKAEGGELTGTQGAQGQSSPIANGKVDGDTVSWANSITQPFPMTLEFTGTVAGDTLNGNVKAGSFGTFPFKGSRA